MFRPLLTAALSAGAVAGILLLARDPAELWAAATVIGLSALLVFHRHVASQLFVRATLWAHTLVFLVEATVGDDSERVQGAVVVGCLAAALLVIGRFSLDDDARSGAFQPVAFRASMMTGLVLSLALAQWFFLFSGILLVDDDFSARPLLLTFATATGLILLAVYGMFRLAVWGLLLKVLADVGFVALGVFTVVREPHFISFGILGLALLQLGLDLPILLACVRGDRYRPASFAKPGLVLTYLIAIGAAGLAAYSGFVARGPIW